MVTPKAKKALYVSVGPGNIERTVRILDALVRGLEQRGCPVGVDREKECSWAVVQGERIEFKLREQTKQFPNEFADWNYKKAPFEYWRYELSDRLVLEISTYCRDRFRCRWADGKKQRVEGCLNAFVVSLFQIADSIKRHRQKDEEQRLQREAWARERWEKQQEIEAEENRVHQLIEESESWDKSQKIRRYIEAVRETTGDREDRSQIEEWIKWATDQADRADPLVESPSSILDEKQKWRL